MSQGLPLFDFDEDIITNNFDAHSNSSNFLTTDNNGVSWLELDNESLELLWEEGQLAMQTFGSPPLANGTIESIVNQATHQPQPTVVVDGGENTIEHHHHSGSNPAYVTMPVDLPLTCNNNSNNNNNNNSILISNEYLQHPTHELDFVPWSTRAGSCSSVMAGGDCLARAGIGWRCETNCGSATCCWGRDTCQLTLDSTTYNKELGLGGTASTILASSGNTFSGGQYTITTTVGEEPGFVGLSGSLAYKNDRKGDEEGTGSEAVTKKRRNAANHNQSERKRREKINDRIHTLQKMLPNSTKTDKASILDEVIEYLKQLQAQVLGNVNVTSPMMLQLAMQQQQLQMSMINNIGIATAALPPATATAAFNPPPAAELDPLLAYLASQSQVQPMGRDAYVRLTTLYQQFQQISGSHSNIWL